MNHSVILRCGVFSGVRKVFLTSCCVSVLPPARYFLVAEEVGEDRAPRSDGIDARMIVEAAILDREDRLPIMRRRNRLQRHVAPLLAAPA